MFWSSEQLCATLLILVLGVQRVILRQQATCRYQHLLNSVPVKKTIEAGTSKKRRRVKEDKKACDVEINTGIMVKENNRVIKKEATLPLTVPYDIPADDLLEKTVEKHTRFKKDVVNVGKIM